MTNEWEPQNVRTSNINEALATALDVTKLSERMDPTETLEFDTVDFGASASGANYITVGGYDTANDDEPIALRLTWEWVEP